MLRADEILKLLPKVNQYFSVCPLYQERNFHQFYQNEVCQFVLYDHVKSSNRLSYDFTQVSEKNFAGGYKDRFRDQ